MDSGPLSIPACDHEVLSSWQSSFLVSEQRAETELKGKRQEVGAPGHLIIRVIQLSNIETAMPGMQLSAF